MRLSRALLTAAIAVLLISGCLSRVTIPNGQVGSHAGSIAWDGLERTYLIHIPPSWNKAKSMPLVIVLHGGGGTGAGMVKVTQEGFNALADREGFIVIYPDGIRRQWNDGRELPFVPAMRENVDDVGFISTLIDHLAERFNIDRSRIYATGISNGGLMSQRLAFELPDKIAAIAVVAISMSENISKMPPPARAIPALIMMGTEDPLVPWEGGEIGFVRGRKRGRVLSVPETVRFWVAHNQCLPSPIITWKPDKDPRDDTRVRRELHGEGKDGAEVILYAIEGGGHIWPGGWQYLPERIIGKANRDIDANEVIWNFFKRHAIR